MVIIFYLLKQPKKILKLFSTFLFRFLYLESMFFNFFERDEPVKSLCPSLAFSNTSNIHFLLLVLGFHYFGPSFS